MSSKTDLLHVFHFALFASAIVVALFATVVEDVVLLVHASDDAEAIDPTGDNHPEVDEDVYHSRVAEALALRNRAKPLAEEGRCSCSSSPSCECDVASPNVFPVRVLVVGDAITKGVSSSNKLPNLKGGSDSFRRPLWLELQKRLNSFSFVDDSGRELRPEFAFVGPERESHPEGFPPNFADFPTAHAGGWSLSAEEALNSGALKNLVQAHQPHIMVLQLGTNDLGRRSQGGADPEDAVASVVANLMELAAFALLDEATAVRKRASVEGSEGRAEAGFQFADLPPQVFVLPLLPTDEKRHSNLRAVDSVNRKLQFRLNNAATGIDTGGLYTSCDVEDTLRFQELTSEESWALSSWSNLCHQEELINGSISEINRKRPKLVRLVPVDFVPSKHVIWSHGLLPNAAGEEVIASAIIRELHSAWTRHVRATMATSKLKARRAKLRKQQQQIAHPVLRYLERQTLRSRETQTAGPGGRTVPKWVVLVVAFGISSMFGIVAITYLRSRSVHAAQQRIIYIRDRTTRREAAVENRVSLRPPIAAQRSGGKQHSHSADVRETPRALASRRLTPQSSAKGHGSSSLTPLNPPTPH